MNGMDRGRFEELKDAYVLGALPEEDNDEFERNLAAHPERQAEVDELGAYAKLLAFSPQQQEPPPELRRNVMAMIEAEAAPQRVRRRSMFAGIREYLDARSIALGAAAMLVRGLLSWNVLLQDQVRHLTGQVEEAQAERPDRQVQESRTISLEGGWAQQGASAEVATIDENREILVAENMPSVPENRECQIWVIHDDVLKPSGLFDPKGNMIAAVVTSSIKKADAIAVTVEPAGGSEKPTSEPVLLTPNSSNLPSVAQRPPTASPGRVYFPRQRVENTAGKAVGKEMEGELMSVARVTELSAVSETSFEDAIQQGVSRATSTLRGVEGAWIKDMNVLIEDGNIIGYKVNMEVTFVLEG